MPSESEISSSFRDEPSRASGTRPSATGGSLPHAFVAEAVGKRWGTAAAPFVALEGVSLCIEAGSYVAITGASGSGKSTLLRILGGLDARIDGSLTVFGQDILALSDAERAALRGASLGFVFQSYELLPHLTARENVLLPAMWTAAPDADKRADALLDAVGLAHKSTSFPDTLSGGQQQRVAIARALLLRPKALLCDEPTGSLDSSSSARVLDVLEQAHRRDGATLVIATHDPEVVARAQRVLRLHDGRLVEDTARAGGQAL